MRTTEQYITGLGKMRKNLYSKGETIARDDERLAPAIDTIALTFDYAARPECGELCTAKSHLTGKTINRFSHIHQSTEDLHKKQDMTRMLCRFAGGCVKRCMGTDAANALYAVSFEADKQNAGATNYHRNFLKWLEAFQEEDLVACAAQTDVKGDRMKRPSQQQDLDLYVRVVERRSDGIVVRGAKVHNSIAAISDEILVLPTRSLSPEEKDWAVAFAVPGDWEGVKQVVTFHNLRERQHFRRGFAPGDNSSYTIFDNCFVPWDRVFLCGETSQAGICALLFALFHRHSYSGCKPAAGDLLVGTAALVAEYNGIAKASHVRDKLAEIIRTSELGYAAGFTASAMGKPEVWIPGVGVRPYGPGGYIPNSIYANVGRCLSGEAVYREAELLTDLSGGMPATFPNEEDFLNPETGDLLYKYITRNPKIHPEDAAQLWRFVSDILCSAAGGIHNMGAYHGGGSPIMESITITSQYDIESRTAMVKKLAGIQDKKVIPPADPERSAEQSK